MRLINYLGALIGLLLVCSNVCAQNITNYSFNASTGTYVPLSSGVTPGLSGGDFDEGWFSNIPIGFEFWYMGNLITNVHASTNGLISLSANLVPSGAAANNNLAASLSGFFRPYIAPLWDNLDMDSTSGAKFTYETQGFAPNRVFVAEWKNAEWNWFANDATLSFQVRLYESTGVIEYIYNQENGMLFSPSASIGITGQTNTSFLSLNNSSGAPTVSSTSSTNLINAKPASGQIYTFTPPVPPALSMVNVGSATPTSLTLSWSLVAGAVKYAIYASTDNVTFNYIGNSSSTSFLASSLFPNTTYYFRVYSISEGAYSALPATGTGSTQVGAVSGIITIPGMAPTITSVIDSIRNYGIGGNVIIELQSTYNPSGERFPIYLSDSLGTSSAATLTLRPEFNATNVEIYAPSTYYGSLLYLMNAKYITIDGSPGGLGLSKELTIRSKNGNTGLYFFTNANSYSGNNTVTNLKFKAAVGITTLNSFIEVYSYASANSSLNSITNCEIGDSNVSAFYGIRINQYSITSPNRIYIANNRIFNVGSASSAGYGISVFGNSTSQIHIEGNHIYNFAPIAASGTTFTFYGIYLTGGNHIINNNYIGGSDTACGGNAFEIGPATANNTFYGIYYYGSGSQWASIQGNKVANFFWPGIAVNPWNGIMIMGGTAYVGDTIPNIIGEPNQASPSIYVLSQNSTNTPIACGIRSTTTASVRIKDNKIAGITAVGVNSTFPCSVVGILASGFAQGDVSGNTIGSATIANSLRAASPTGSYPQFAVGIMLNSSSVGQLTVSNNSIANVVNSSSSTTLQNYTAGLHITSNAAATIKNNQIFKLYAASGNPSTNGIPAMVGLYYNTTSGSATIGNNLIHTLRTTNASSPANNMGMNIVSTSGSPISIDANFIHSLSTASSALGANQIGINLQDGIVNVTNNMIRLGIDHNGSSVSTSNGMFGINKITSYDVQVYHNTVLIGGTATAVSLVNTYAFRKANDGSDQIKNNIFCNLRNNATVGGKHYAIGLNSANNISSNYNLVFAPATNGRLYQLGSTDYNTRYTWYNATGLDDNSDSASVPFVNASGDATGVDLHLMVNTPTKAEGNGGSTFVTHDFDGQLRSTLGPVDIGADAGVFVKQNIVPVPVIWLWVKGSLNNDGALITWQVASQLNNSMFIVQRSIDGKYFVDLDKVEGAGTLNALATYTYYDKSVFATTSPLVYYRIMQIDFNGASGYSKVIALANNKVQQQGILLWPNPTSDLLAVQLPEVNQAQKIEVELLNYSGVVCKQFNIPYRSTIQLSLKELEPGVYFIKVKIDGEHESIKRVLVTP